VWAAARFDLVVEGNVAKFGQHPELGTYLLGTSNRVLVEASGASGWPRQTGMPPTPNVCAASICSAPCLWRPDHG
jgi:hypothetical protein